MKARMIVQIAGIGCPSDTSNYEGVTELPHPVPRGCGCCYFALRLSIVLFW